MWLAARDPDTFVWAMKSGANIMATPLSRPHAEVVILGQRFAETLAKLSRRPAEEATPEHIEQDARAKSGQDHEKEKYVSAGWYSSIGRNEVKFVTASYSMTTR